MEYAFYLLQKLADQGMAKAQFFLVVMYEHGEGVQKNLERAVHYYRKAAGQGHDEAQSALDRLLNQ